MYLYGKSSETILGIFSKLDFAILVVDFAHRKSSYCKIKSIMAYRVLKDFQLISLFIITAT